MKQILLVGVLLLTTLKGWSQPDQYSESTERSFVGQYFTSTVHYSQPLTTFDTCLGANPAVTRNNWDYGRSVIEGATNAGAQAYSEAARIALNACEQKNNFKCLIVSAAYNDVISTEFIGYKACRATVTVLGIKVTL